jgi:hypothetical protein
LRRRHIAIAIEFGVLTDTETYGRAVEGYNGEALALVAGRIIQLGGELKYLAMDEPLWFGRYYAGKNACHATIDEIAKDAAENIRALRAVAPNVLIGDIEPFRSSDYQDWNNEIMRWVTAFYSAIGNRLEFLHADILWDQAWMNPIASIASRVRADGIAFGVIYNGNSDDSSDVTWITHAEEHYLEYEGANSGPDHAIFQSWMNFPTHVLPETSRYTMMGLARGYLRASTKVDLDKHGKRLEVRLLDDDGLPIAGGTIHLAIQKKTGLGELGHARISGIVPAAAYNALFAVRVNMECSCHGQSELAFEAAGYKELPGKASAKRDFSTGLDKWHVAGSSTHEITASSDRLNMLHIQARPQEEAMVNSTKFRVTPNAPFEADFQLRVKPGSAGSGYVEVI